MLRNIFRCELSKQSSDSRTDMETSSKPEVLISKTITMIALKLMIYIKDGFVQ